MSQGSGYLLVFVFAVAAYLLGSLFNVPAIYIFLGLLSLLGLIVMYVLTGYVRDGLNGKVTLNLRGWSGTFEGAKAKRVGRVALWILIGLVALPVIGLIGWWMNR